MRYEYEPDPVLYYQPRSYTPDFALESGVLLEVKGYFPPDQRQKMRAVKQAHPELDIRFIFTDPNKKLSRARNARTYAQWCEFHGFLWCRADSIPKEWLT